MCTLTTPFLDRCARRLAVGLLTASCLVVPAAAEPVRSDVLALLAASLASTERYDELIVLARARTRETPTDPIGWGARGDAALALGLYEEGELAYQKMMDLNPGLPAYARAARLRTLHGDVAGAAQMWGLAIDAGHARDPRPLAEVLIGAADLAASQGAYGAALPLYEQALKLDPELAPAAVGRTRCLAGPGWAVAPDITRERGEGELVAALASVRGDVWADAARALAWARLGDLDAAAELAHRALALGTVDAKVWMLAGLALEAAGESGEARLLIDAARALDPASADEVAASALGQSNGALDEAAAGPMTAALLAREWQTVLGERDEDVRQRLAVTLVDRWRGQVLSWQVRALANLCFAARNECIVHAFRRGDIPDESGLFGTFVRVALRPGAYARIAEGCRGAADCVVTLTGTLSTLDLMPEDPIVIALSDGEVTAARPPGPEDPWAEAVVAKQQAPLNAAHMRPREGEGTTTFDASKLYQARF